MNKHAIKMRLQSIAIMAVEAQQFIADAEIGNRAHESLLDHMSDIRHDFEKLEKLVDEEIES